jgi:hypothetical protein
MACIYTDPNKENIPPSGQKAKNVKWVTIPGQGNLELDEHTRKVEEAAKLYRKMKKEGRRTSFEKVAGLYKVNMWTLKRWVGRLKSGQEAHDLGMHGKHTHQIHIRNAHILLHAHARYLQVFAAALGSSVPLRKSS